MAILPKAGNTLEAIGIGKYCLSRTPAAQQLRGRMDKLDYMKLKTSAQQSGRKYLLGIYQTKD
jgi:hypothetical protein